MSVEANRARVFGLTHGLSAEVSRLLGMVTILEFSIENFNVSELEISDLAALTEQIKNNTESLVSRAQEVFDMGQVYIKATAEPKPA